MYNSKLVDSYIKRGFCKYENFLDRESVTENLYHAFSIYNGRYETGIPPIINPHGNLAVLDGLYCFDNSHWSDNTLFKLATNLEIGRLAANLLNVPCIRLWGTQLIFKHPRSGIQSKIGWHNDGFYWQCVEPQKFVTAWVTLTDIKKGMGCLRYVAKNVKLNASTGGFVYDKSANNKIDDLIIESQSQIVEMINKTGSICFHDSQTFHCSDQNFDDDWRVSFSIHLMADGVSYKSGSICDNHLNVKLLNGLNGDKFRGPNFPVVYSSLLHTDKYN